MRTVSIVVTLSRPHYADLVRQNLRNLETNGEVAEVIIVIDGMGEFGDWSEVEDKYHFVKIETVSGRKPSTDNIPRLRDRITEVRNFTQQLLADSDYVFSFEDDTEVPPNALWKLQTHLMELPQEPGLLSGVQVGRHSRKLLGAWEVDDPIFPKEMTSLRTDVSGLIEVDGTGFYCFLTPTALYKSVRFGWREPAGPDTWYGLRLRERGYRNFVDTDIVCPHHTKESVLVPNSDTVRCQFFLDNTGRWSHKVVRNGV